MDYDSMTLLDLKKLCKSRGLRVGGRKDEVIIRLMEYDEVLSTGAAPGANAFPQVIPGHTGGGVAVLPQQQATQFVIVGNNNSSGLASTMGTFILIYGIIRIGIVFFLGFFWGDFMEEYVIESILAFVIGMAYVFGGMMIIAGYRNGVYTVLGTLVVSGILSFVYNDEWSPLSIGLDGFTAPGYTFFCSAFCMILTTLPLLVAPQDLKEGWPEGVQRIVDNASGPSNDSEKKKIKCNSCNQSLRVPNGFSGKVRCPSCETVLEV
ncbi:MAG: SAP domain-containing protein [Candidatus Poseidoniaceae archaeon]|nr:SAP domain-containing protein [Candidatus Poseidoniaceae archaeon]